MKEKHQRKFEITCKGNTVYVLAPSRTQAVRKLLNCSERAAKNNWADFKIRSVDKTSNREG